MLWEIHLFHLIHLFISKIAHYANIIIYIKYKYVYIKNTKMK